MKKLFKMFVMCLVLLFSPNIFSQVTFSGPTNFTLGTSTNSLTHADINGDGKQDIIATRQDVSEKVTVLLNTTAIGAVTPTFSAATDFTIGGYNYSSIAVADLNGDGKPDIVVSTDPGTVSVLLNTTLTGAAAPTFSSYTSFTVGDTPWSVAIADVNGDGKPDIVTANNNASGTVSVLLNTTSNGASTPSFSSKTDFTVGALAYSVAIADLNGDGKPDIATANKGASTVSVLLNTTSNGASTPSFSSKTDFTVGVNVYSVAIADLNGDNKPDIVTANKYDGTVSVLINTTSIGASTPAFSSKSDFTVGTSPVWVAIADFDGDGKSDIVTANNGANTVSVLLNTTTVGASTPTFSSKSDFAVGASPTSVTNADINGDNKIDIITSNTTASVLLNTTNSAPTFTSTPITAVNGNEIYTYGITTADAENDVVTITASLPSGWPTLTTTTQVTTFAGSSYGFADGTGVAAKFRYPEGVAVDVSGNLFVVDKYNYRIRKITPAGEVSTLAGSGTAGFADGTGATAQFSSPYGVAVDALGNVYVGDSDNQRIRKITPAGDVSTLAGSGTAGFADGTGAAAQFYAPMGVAVDASGNVYVGDAGNNKIRKITPEGVVSTLAGSTAGFADGTGGAAKFNYPGWITIDASENIYVGDQNNHRIRKVTSLGVVTTLAGSGTAGFADGTGGAAQFNNPSGVAVDASGTVYVADESNQRIRKITPGGVVTTLAGSTSGYADGLGTTAQFNGPQGIAVDAAGIVILADMFNNKIRKITPSGVLTADATGRVGDYAVDISANDGNGGVTHQIFIIHVTNTFTATSGNWSSGGNWSATSIPTSTVSALIPLGKSINVDITDGAVNNLTIHGPLTIDAGKALTVSGTIVNDAGPSGLIIQSNASGTGSLKHNTSGVSAQVQRYMAANAWHLISAPISDALSGIFVGQYLRPYIESTNLWGDYIIPLTTALPAGVGFVCWPVTSQAYTFTGTLNNGTITPGLTRTDGNHGNNLVGNPYPSAIDWNASSGWTKTNIGGTIWIWNQASSNYGTWNGSLGTLSVTQYIPVGQGFFVQATGSPTLSMENEVRVHNTQAFLKNSDLPNALRLHVQNSYGSDEIVVYFDPESSWVYDPQIDSRKMFGDAMAPQLFSFKPGDPEELSINVLPEIKNPLVVPVSLKVGLNGQYTITASQMESFPTNVSLYLEDLKLSKAQDLRINPGYTFSADTNDIARRFNLHFSNFLYGIPGLADDNAFQIYSYGQSIYVKSSTGINNNAQIFVYDALGRTLYQSAFSIISLNNFDLNLSHGYYIVKVLANSGVYTQKIFID